jgi:hypothetical protein
MLALEGATATLAFERHDRMRLDAEMNGTWQSLHHCRA